MQAVYKILDEDAKKHVTDYIKTKVITGNIVNTIIKLYNDVSEEKKFNDEYFQSAYQMSVTPLFEFYLGRLFFHYFKIRGIEAVVYLRKQTQKCAPDIRIEQKGKTKAIIEVKIKGGWIQPFFSQERYDNDIEKKNNNIRDFNPQEIVDKQNDQINKYNEIFGNPLVFVLLPTFNMIHRKKYKATIESYKIVFHKRTGLPKKNLVVLSKNLILNLSKAKKTDNLDLTNDFEFMFESIIKKIRPTTVST